MKYGEYKETRQKEMDDMFEKHGVFFAFSTEQLMANKKEGVKYYSLGMGMFIPQASHEQFKIDYELADENFIKKAKELFSSVEIITYEMANHEYCYTYDMTDTQRVLEDYMFTAEQYAEAKKVYLAECEDF